MSDTCRSCQAPVMWLENVATGKPAPIDIEPTPDGNIVILDEGRYNVLARSERAEAAAEGYPLHTNHFATCAQAASWRGRRPQKAKP
jgi:hypothetical protein